MRELTKRSTEVGIDLDSITDCLITHEHVDHVRGIKTFSKYIPATVWGSQETLLELSDAPIKRALTPNQAVVLGEVRITPIPVKHDAKGPLGFIIEDENSKALVLTDTGKRPDCLDEYLDNLDLVVLEANHNVRMLRNGPYPFHLKKRIMSDFGHLCNEDSGLILADIIKRSPKPPVCFLAHLSEENNRPQIALLDVANTLKENGILPGRDVTLEVASQYKTSRLIEF